MESEYEEEHGLEEAFQNYGNKTMFCYCGNGVCGKTWQSVGYFFDQHLLGENP